MSIFSNGIEILKIMLNGQEIDKIMSNGVEVFAKDTGGGWVKTHTLSVRYIFGYYYGMYFAEEGGHITPPDLDGYTITFFASNGGGEFDFRSVGNPSTKDIVISTSTDSWTIPYFSSGQWESEGSNVATLSTLLSNNVGNDLDFKIGYAD